VFSSSTSPDCLSGDQVGRFLECRLTADESARARAHLSTGCPTCQQAVVAASRSLPGGSGPDVTRHPAEGSLPQHEQAARLPPGTAVARYRVVRYIGGGGGGQVYEALDPHLGRAVALKMVRAEVAEGAQVVDEARALAKLSHPNVVNVHDAGIFEGRAFVVMELVEGLSLARWLEQAPRDWREIARRFIDAGKGLAAAHAAGLVHRDVKPANVIVGLDGRARMADFGLAQPSGHTPRAGQTAGTPAYMAPEQLVGEPADARSDQFSFCVAFYWALYGQHPYQQASVQGATLLAVAREVIAGRIRRPPPGRSVPAWLEKAVARGLSADPEARHPSMVAVLDEIDRGLRAPAPGRLRRRVLAGVLMAVALVGVGMTAGVSGRMRRSAAAHRCGDGQRWSPVEECDDGNRSQGDGCSNQCLRCDAGDARFVWAQTGRCYSRHDAPLPWREAAATCSALGAHLVSLNAWAEMREVSTQLLGGRREVYWTGLSDAWAIGEYRWNSGEPQNLLLRWWADQPPAGRCVSFDAAGSVNAALKPMRAEPCDEARPFVCEKEEWRTSPVNGHAYRHVGMVQTFDEATAACARAGGHLLTIADGDENAFTGGQFLGTLWLSAIKRKKAGYFEWTTGEPFDFEYFAPGDPDLNLIPDCVVMGEDRKWYDRACDGTKGGPYGAVCEVE
jgi:cysteine-rich repeat protein